MNYNILNELVDKHMEAVLVDSNVYDCVHGAMCTSIEISQSFALKEITFEEYQELLNKAKQVTTKLIYQKFSSPSLN